MADQDSFYRIPMTVMAVGITGNALQLQSHGVGGQCAHVVGWPVRATRSRQGDRPSWPAGGLCSRCSQQVEADDDTHSRGHHAHDNGRERYDKEKTMWTGSLWQHCQSGQGGDDGGALRQTCGLRFQHQSSCGSVLLPQDDHVGRLVWGERQSILLSHPLPLQLNCVDGFGARITTKTIFHGGIVFFSLGSDDKSAYEILTRDGGFTTISENPFSLVVILGPPVKIHFRCGCLRSSLAKITLFLLAGLLTYRQRKSVAALEKISRT